MDEAHEWTEQEIERLTRDLEREYNQAAKEMRDKLAKMLADFDEENGKWKERLASGSATQKEYEAWLETRAMDKEFVSNMADTLAQDAVNADKRAMELVNNAIPTVYAENANRAAFDIDSRLGQDHSFDLYDQSTVRRLIANPEADLLPIQQPPIPNPKIDARKDRPWNKRKFSSAITQSILQGESIPNTAKRLQTVLKMDENAAVRAARTAMTGAENAGRVDSYRRAKAIGIDLEQEWMATLDMRTRHSHRELDGQHVPVGEKFKVDDIELEFPADPTAPPEYVYNCRCTLVAWFPDLDEDERWSKLPSGMTYDEWKNGKKAEDGVRNGPFNFSDYKQGTHIQSQSAWISSLPTSMHGEPSYDFRSGDYLTDAAKAANYAAHFTGDDWTEYAYEKVLDEAICGTSEHFSGPLFRGMSVDKDTLAGYIAGAKVKPRGIQSWSSDHEVALGFAKINYEPVMMVDVTTKEKMAMSIQCLSQASYEHEVLASMSIEYEVVRTYEKEFEVWNKFREEYVKRTVTVVEVVET